MPAAAVQAVGVDYMHTIRSQALSGRLPAYARGGLVGGTSNGGGLKDTVNVNLNLGGETHYLSGEREQVRKLSRAIQNTTLR